MPIKKIMVVDDSPTERFFLQELLSKRGYSLSLIHISEPTRPY